MEVCAHACARKRRYIKTLEYFVAFIKLILKGFMKVFYFFSFPRSTAALYEVAFLSS